MSQEYITLKFENQVLTIDTLGAQISRYYLIDAQNNKLDDIIFGYQDRKQWEAAMQAVLAPWPGRIDKGKFSFNGREFSVQAPRMDPNGNAIHGFAMHNIWNCQKLSESEIKCTLVLSEEKLQAAGFPFGYELCVLYSMKSGQPGLTINTQVKNIGTSDAPFGIGFHPYFTIGGNSGSKVDDFIVHVPSRSLIEYDAQLKPTGKILDVTVDSTYKELDFFDAVDANGKKPIGQTVIDNCYTQLESDAATGIATTTLTHVNMPNRRIHVWQDAKAYPYIQLYSFDKQSPNKRKALAIEPESCCGFAFNVPGLGLQTLPVGQTWTGTWGIKFEGY